MTQVVAAAEGHVFHNRLTHTLEVAQIGRRLAEKLLAERGPDVAEAVGGIDPEVVEGAALAHDLGHPPFGHIAEEVLDGLVREEDVPDGFEGNAQSFRIVTKLAVRHGEFPGLNLTRATMNAILKYPWFRQTGEGLKQRKFGAFHTEEEEFHWARESFSDENQRSAEAELMDWADDIAYAVHDVEDFYRAGLVPLDRLRTDTEEIDRFCDEVFERWKREEGETPFDEAELMQVFTDLVVSLPIEGPYSGTRTQRSALRSITAVLIKRYIEAIDLEENAGPGAKLVATQPWANMELAMLKQLIWHYVVNNPGLATQQYGQRIVIRELFRIYRDAANSDAWEIFPVGSREQLEKIQDEAKNKKQRRHFTIRTVADLIASMTEQQAIDMYQRLTGMSFGSVLNPIVR